MGRTARERRGRGPRGPGRWARFRASLAFHPGFRRLWLGDAASQIGATATLFVLPLLAATVLDATPFQVGLVSTSMTAAFLLLGLPTGAWVDRMRCRRVLIIADAGRALALATLPLAAAAGVLTLPQLCLVALGYGVLTVFFDVAYQSYLPHLVGRDRLVEGNAKLAATQSVAQMGGPAAGGAAVQALTAPYAVVANVACFVWSAVWIARIRAPEARPPRDPDRHLGREIGEGLRFVFGHRLLRAIAGCTGAFNLFRSAGQPMLIVLLSGGLGLSAAGIGLFFTVGAAGGVAGAFFARRIAAAAGQGRTMWASTAGAGLCALLVPLAQDDWRLWLAAAGEFGLVFGAAVYDVAQVSFRQTLCPGRLLGRMNATMRFLVWGTMPLGAFLGGALASVAGPRTVLWVAAAGMTTAFLPLYLSPLRGLRRLPGAEAAAGVPSGPGAT
ncbi:MFS transporter [Actinomadura viridis]|uniref:MFS family permease n=1 Tax=Actinomadura viridis TaxID=58110 RepID=A0A931DKQ8_9ACTN|nr:MFS transporter [Actinomadura viridis]MBG6090373.1 MFS family permease [Actinomadura viridis]